ncbi:hypothetical protein SAMN02745216_05013 [Desulfatibacillum alkenivorans DSM 16219]|uniref:BP74 N-terminal domain-containing protein n=1 Tax=Desulfatibacillum alkenivorans DSM 16219 TaxID=1121393 RepID=A0A1M6ZPN5_9BACT|nr:hypothetical protein SAMN02745216_05013 [Desulfatibacillum alkenivorans DSM 16219]
MKKKHLIQIIKTLCLALFIRGLFCLSPAWGEVRYFEFALRGYSDSENFIAATSNPATIAQVEAQLQAPEDQRRMHINGNIAAGNGGVNHCWGWHHVTNQWALAEMSMELCDGRPSHVEDDLDYWLNTVGGFCPWSSYALREVGKDSVAEGDVNNDNAVNLDDALVSLQIASGLDGPPCLSMFADVNGDDSIGIEEAIYILQVFVRILESSEP